MAPTASEGVKLDRLEFTLDISEDIPIFENVQACQNFFNFPVHNGITKYRFSVSLDQDVTLYFSNRRGLGRKLPACKLVIGHVTANKIPINQIWSKVSQYRIPGFIFRALCRVDVCSDRFIPFENFISNIMPLGTDVFHCRSDFDVVYRNGKKAGTYQYGKGDVVVRLYDKQHEQKTDFPWSRAEIQFRGNKIRDAEVRQDGTVDNDSLYSIEKHEDIYDKNYVHGQKRHYDMLDYYSNLSDVGLLDTVLNLVSCGIDYFRPLQKEVESDYRLCETSEYWLELFSDVSNPRKLPPRRRNNAYYV